MTFMEYAHELQVLANGIEVKLQRNALSVIETPAVHEEDDDNASYTGASLPMILWIQIYDVTDLGR